MKKAGMTPNLNTSALRNQQIQKRNAANLKSQDASDKLSVKNSTTKAQSGIAETTAGTRNEKAKTEKTEKKKDKVTLTTTQEAEKSEAAETPVAEEKLVAEEKAPEGPKEKSTEEQFTDFHSRSAELLGPETVTKLFSEATRELEASPKSGPVSAEEVVAFSVYRHSIGEIRKELGNPEASLKDAKKAAKGNEKVAGLVGLVESSKAYLNKVDAEKKASGTENVAESSSNKAAEGSQEVEGQGAILADGTGVGNGANVSGQAAVNPFAEVEGGTQAAGATPGSSETPPPSTMGPAERAQQAADHAKQMEEIRTIYQQMWKSMMEGMAERHKIMMETMNSINDIFRSIHNSRQASMNKHHADFMALVTETGADKW